MASSGAAGLNGLEFVSDRLALSCGKALAEDPNIT